MNEYTNFICYLYGTHTVEELANFFDLTIEEIREILVENKMIEPQSDVDEEYAIAKELYVSGETLKSIYPCLKYHTKGKFRKRLLDDGVLREEAHKTYLEKEEYLHLQDLAYVYVQAKNNKSLLSICDDLGITYSRLHYICKKLSRE